jgi:hypothetical protein
MAALSLARTRAAMAAHPRTESGRPDGEFGMSLPSSERWSAGGRFVYDVSQAT